MPHEFGRAAVAGPFGNGCAQQQFELALNGVGENTDGEIGSALTPRSLLSAAVCLLLLLLAERLL